MFFLNKRRLRIITICFTIPLIFLGLNKKGNIVETVALPIQDKVIIIDAGHGNPDNRSIKQ